jgi:hypothetical protein
MLLSNLKYITGKTAYNPRKPGHMPTTPLPCPILQWTGSTLLQKLNTFRKVLIFFLTLQGLIAI